MSDASTGRLARAMRFTTLYTVEINGPMPTRAVQGQRAMTGPRARILELVQVSAEACTVASLSSETGLHENTVRGHLEALSSDGHLQRVRVQSAGRGRPAWGYVASKTLTEPDMRVRDHAGLAGALARHLSATRPDPENEAEAAGFVWGQNLWLSESGSTRPTGPTTTSDDLVMSLMTGLGFAPQRDQDGKTVRLTRCPLLDTAREVPEVVCGVHRGLLRGALSEQGFTSEGLELLPFAERHACLLTLPDQPVPSAAPDKDQDD